MRIVRKLLFMLVALIVIAVTIVFMLQNRQPVALTFLGWTAPETSVAVPVVAALLAGLMVGPILGWIITLRKKPRHTSHSS